MTLSTPAPLHHLVAGEWITGHGEQVSSLNPARPRIVVAHGAAATASDVDDAVTAAAGALRAWSATPIHQRGAVLLAAADIIDRHAQDWGANLAAEEGKTRAE